MQDLGLATIAAGVGVAAAAAAATYCVLRHGQKPRGTFAARVDDIASGTMKEVKVGEQTVLLSHTVDGKILATGSKCTHNGARLVTGVLSGDRIVCPWHAACFNACTGDIEDGPVVDRIPSFAVEVSADGGIFVTLPSVPTTRVPPRTAQPPGADKRHFVIIGAGAAGGAAAETLRAEGFCGRLTMLAKEAAPPYDRTKLSKNMAVDDVAELALRPPEYYATALRAELKLGAAVVAVRPEAHEVDLAGGAVVRYDKLLCATGGPARTFRRDAAEGFAIDGAELDRVLPLRDLPHAVAIETAVNALGTAAPIVIVGSSFIGMEVAAYLVKTKKCTNVTVLGMETEPFERVLGPRIGAFMRELHAAQGVRFKMGAVAARFVPSARDAKAVGGVELKSGEKLVADIVVLGGGIVPAVGYLKHAVGISLLDKAPGGVRVDETLQAATDVWAAGDIAYFPYAHAPDPAHAFTRVEHWDVAMDQGRVAARNMLGVRTVYDHVPFFWTAQYGKALRYAGHAARTDNVVIDGSLAAGLASEFTAFFIVGGTVAAVATFNRDPQAVAAGELLRRGLMPPAKEVVEAAGVLDLVACLRTRTLAEVGN